MTVARIVVVDDEVDLRETIGDYLRLHGFDVALADGGRALRALLDGRPADLVVLDVRLPEESGLAIARWLRSNSEAAIIMATAAGDVVDRIVGLEIGADDYVGKPLDLRELLARVRAVLRRRVAPMPEKTDDVRFGAFRFDRARCLLIDASGQAIRLARSEADLLGAFADNPDRVLSRDDLLDLVSGKNGDAFDRSIDMRVARIRRKIEIDPAQPTVLRTVRGAGYLYATRA